MEKTTTLSNTMNKHYKKALLPKITSHIDGWKNCTLCSIGANSSHRIMYRGSVPADILVIGEAASDIDIVLNKPFSGPPGKLITKLLDEAFADKDYWICMTYSVICPPCLPPQHKIRQPTDNEIRNCSDRLQEFYNIVKPDHVVAVGRVAEKAIKRLRSLKSTNPLITL